MFTQLKNKFLEISFPVFQKCGFIVQPLKSVLKLGLTEEEFPKMYGKRIIHPSDYGNNYIYNLIISGAPCMISRLGSVELSVIFHYYQLHGKFRNLEWNEFFKTTINSHAGFFPTTDELISRFAKEFTRDLKHIDFLGVWFKPGEDVMVQKYMPNAVLAPIQSIEPYFFREPWTLALKNKKVLVIHPFAKSIYSQYITRRKQIFEQAVLPDFELRVIQAVQSIGTVKTRFRDWFDACESMKEEILKNDFDIAIIGAGAYGLPLASFIKSIGKQAVHMGGATQILFGIRGKRWDDIPNIATLYNEFWVRPTLDETVPNELQVEGYW